MKEENEHIKVKDFLVSGEEFSLCRNQEFGFLETRPQPKPEELSKYYESEAYISHSDDKKGWLAFLYQMVKRYSLKKKVKLINSLNHGPGSLLDVGAGTGEFLKIAKEAHWNVDGVEVNEKARSLAEKKHISLKRDLHDLKGTQFDVITLWHVLEHLPDLDAQVQSLKSLLKEDGYLVIAVPNFNSFDARHYKEFWAAYDAPRHLWHFSQSSLKALFEKHWSLIKTRPMIFDSFYVSLLSEKYKTGKAFSLRAFWIGLRSNIGGWRSKEYSSLIYTFKKDK